MTTTHPEKAKLLFVVTEDWYFYSHRLPMARAAQRAGCEVGVVTAVKDHRSLIEAEGIKVIDLQMERRNLNPFKALVHIGKLAAIYRREKPAIVHHIAMKPILYGSIAAWITGVPRIINAFAGLGYVFSEKTGLAGILRPILLFLFRLFLKRKNSYVLLQNKDDYVLLEGQKLLVAERTKIVRGSGIDLDKYKMQSFQSPDPDFICVFAGRMIGIKGLPAMKEAFALLAGSRPDVKLWLCGRPDPENPGSWTEEQLQEWMAENPNVIWKGHCGDMKAVWGQSHLALQPSYGGEGVPKSLLEAAACGRAIVATDTPGCREMVEEGKNGFLVPPRDARALSESIAALADDPALCGLMGEHSRKIVESDLSAENVSKAVEDLYRECLRDLL